MNSAAKSALFGVLLLVFNVANSAKITDRKGYDDSLPFWGVSWSTGQKDVGGYYPSFYTGFAMRSEFPDRIHVRTARGNQTRVTVILDQQTVMDYTYDLAKRYSFYQRMTSGSLAPLSINPPGAGLLPQLSFFNQVVESPVYGILEFAKGNNSNEVNYAKGLSVLKALNPGRVFSINLNLNVEFAKWQTQMKTVTGGDANKVLGNPAAVISAINSLVFGRINYTQSPSAEVMASLQKALELGLFGSADFNEAALELFKAVTGSRYQIQVLNADGKFQSALQCSADSCFLTYPEFTAIYPTGSVLSFTDDENGNKIPKFATPGLWQFLSRSYHDVDHIRDEPYYGFIPKMDYQDIGNGFHNPAVRFSGVSSAIKSTLGIDPKHNTLWAVKRGGVSHGCLRLPAGHIWEMRHIFPVENAKMTQIFFFGNNARDFDLYDVNGDGQIEVMGVEYFISYNLAGTDDIGYRTGADMTISTDKKIEFYNDLYGSKNVFSVVNQKPVFSNPKISMPSYLDFRKTTVSARMTMPGKYPLYEQSYEKDKVQFYGIDSFSTKSKTLIRLMGRVRGCAPGSDKRQCGEAAFDAERAGMGL